MVDSIQVLLIVVITVLTVLLTFIGIEIYRILKELRQGIKKINEILDDAHTVSSSVAEPISEVSELFTGVKKGVGFIRHVAEFFKEEGGFRTKDKKETAEEHNSEGKKRFFVKSGRSLGKNA